MWGALAAIALYFIEQILFIRIQIYAKLVNSRTQKNVIQSSIKLYHQIEYFLYWKMRFLIFPRKQIFRVRKIDYSFGTKKGVKYPSSAFLFKAD